MKKHLFSTIAEAAIRNLMITLDVLASASSAPPRGGSELLDLGFRGEVSFRTISEVVSFYCFQEVKQHQCQIIILDSSGEIALAFCNLILSCYGPSKSRLTCFMCERVPLGSDVARSRYARCQSANRPVALDNHDPDVGLA